MVKKWWMIMLLAAFLTGCANVQELETMNDDFVMPEAVPGRVLLDLPGDAGEEALCGSADRQLPGQRIRWWRASACRSSPHADRTE